jgi:hypothetical protein
MAPVFAGWQSAVAPAAPRKRVGAAPGKRSVVQS